MWLFTPPISLILAVAATRDGQAELPGWLIKYGDKMKQMRLESTSSPIPALTEPDVQQLDYHYAKLPLISIVR